MPMSGKSFEQIKEERQSIFEEICKYDAGAEYELLDQIYKLIKPNVTDDEALFCLGFALSVMSEADLVYFADGWKESRGCKIEHLCAEKYGKVMVEKV